MFAINHAATALVLKKKFPNTSMVWLLISVQFIELLWVALNYLGIEVTTTDTTVKSIANIHLTHMPFSHSVALTLLLAGIAWLILGKVLQRPTLGLAVAIGVTSHIVLDLLTHSADIALFPGVSLRVGLGLYSLPFVGFVAETVYGIWCWWAYKGSSILLAVIVLFNLANISFFTTSIVGPEFLLANHPLVIVSLIFVQIIVTLYLVGRLSRRVPESQSVSRATTMGVEA